MAKLDHYLKDSPEGRAIRAGCKLQEELGACLEEFYETIEGLCPDIKTRKDCLRALDLFEHGIVGFEDERGSELRPYEATFLEYECLSGLGRLMDASKFGVDDDYPTIEKAKESLEKDGD